MVAVPKLILLPPPAARRGENARIDEGAERRRRIEPGNDNAVNFAGDAALETGADAGRSQSRPQARRRSFADELVGESGRASAGLAFAAQRIAQERLSKGAHFEDWRAATAAYAQAARYTEAGLGGFGA
jgi:hypothetical protein